MTNLKTKQCIAHMQSKKLSIFASREQIQEPISPCAALVGWLVPSIAAKLLVVGMEGCVVLVGVIHPAVAPNPLGMAREG